MVPKQLCIKIISIVKDASNLWEYFILIQIGLYMDQSTYNKIIADKFFWC